MPIVNGIRRPSGRLFDHGDQGLMVIRELLQEISIVAPTRPDEKPDSVRLAEAWIGGPMVWCRFVLSTDGDWHDDRSVMNTRWDDAEPIIQSSLVAHLNSIAPGGWSFGLVGKSAHGWRKMNG